MTPWTVARQAPLSMDFFRQGFWSGLPFPSPGDLPDPGTEPGSHALQLTCNVGELGFIPGLGRSHGDGNSYQLGYFGLENSMDSTVLGVSKSWTLLGNYHTHSPAL